MSKETYNQDSTFTNLNQAGTDAYNILTPELSTTLRNAIINDASLSDCLKTLPLISVDSVTAWAAARNKVLSSKTVLAFLLREVDNGSLYEQHDERGNQYFERTDAFNRLNPISQVQRQALAKVQEFKQKGFQS